MLQEARCVRQQNADLPEDVEALKGLIAKLRWAGMDMDADRLCHELEARAPADCVVLGPHETD